MRRGVRNAVVDTALLIVFVPSLVSALVLYFVLPSGGHGGGTFLSVQRSTWATMHDYAGLLFITLLVLHLVPPLPGPAPHRSVPRRVRRHAGGIDRPLCSSGR